MQHFSDLKNSVYHRFPNLRPLRNAWVLSFLLVPDIPHPSLHTEVVTTALLINLPPTHIQCQWHKSEIQVLLVSMYF